MTHEPSLLNLPDDLPDHLYASGIGALTGLRYSSSTALVNEHQQFCTAYLQALEDVQAIDPHIARMPHAEVEVLSVAARALLNARLP